MFAKRGRTKKQRAMIGSVPLRSTPLRKFADFLPDSASTPLRPGHQPAAPPFRSGLRAGSVELRDSSVALRDSSVALRDSFVALRAGSVASSPLRFALRADRNPYKTWSNVHSHYGGHQTGIRSTLSNPHPIRNRLWQKQCGPSRTRVRLVGWDWSIQLPGGV